MLPILSADVGIEAAEGPIWDGWRSPHLSPSRNGRDRFLSRVLYISRQLTAKASSVTRVSRASRCDGACILLVNGDLRQIPVSSFDQTPSECMRVAKLCHAAVWLTATAVSSMNTTQVPPKAVAR